jgi:hypothetical protein
MDLQEVVVVTGECSKCREVPIPGKCVHCTGEAQHLICSSCFALWHKQSREEYDKYGARNGRLICPCTGCSGAFGEEVIARYTFPAAKAMHLTAQQRLPSTATREEVSYELQKGAARQCGGSSLGSSASSSTDDLDERALIYSMGPTNKSSGCDTCPHAGVDPSFKKLQMDGKLLAKAKPSRVAKPAPLGNAVDEYDVCLDRCCCMVSLVFLILLMYVWMM